MLEHDASREAVELLAAVLSRVAEAVPRAEPPAEGLDAKAAAALLGISVSKLHGMNAAGQLPAAVELGDGRCPRWLRSELLAWFRSGAPARSKWALMRDQYYRRAVG